jgi:hypothetical protein
MRLGDAAGAALDEKCDRVQRVGRGGGVARSDRVAIGADKRGAPAPRRLAPVVAGRLGIGGQDHGKSFVSIAG